ncbi:MAG: DUF2905 domain-containing protein [Candidatus Schekmanbacteria bacterium]|nr:DUF2905 domain-containing protein [Candidatus Schekmanbacteria bacterium]
MNPLNLIGKNLIIFGIVLLVLGAALLFADKIPFLGRLPGDIYIEKKGFSFYFPVITCIILSIVLTLVLNFFSRR